MMRTLCLTLLLAGCSQTPPSVYSGIQKPEEIWMESAKELPPIPACDPLKTLKDRVACRAEYDRVSRTQYVDLASRHEALAGWSRVITREKAQQVLAQK